MGAYFCRGGMAVSKVEAPGYPGHPPPLSDRVVNCYHQLLLTNKAAL